MVTRLMIAALCSACTACAAAPRAPAPEPAPLRVMTFNIFAGNDLERRSNITRVAALIDSLDVDVVFMQEVDRLTRRSGGVDIAGELAALTGLAVAFGRSMDFDDGEYGNAVLSRLPIAASSVHAYDTTGTAAAEPRSLLHLVADWSGRPLHLVSTHLDHRAGSPARARQVMELTRYAERLLSDDVTLILGADLNARPDAPELAPLNGVLRDAWILCGTGESDTFRADAPDRRIDYILLGGAGCTRAWVPAIMISDHRPVVADVLPLTAARPVPR